MQQKIKKREQGKGPQPRRWSLALAFCCLLAVIALTGCGPARQQGPEAAVPLPLTKTVADGPLQVELRVERSRMTVADRLAVTLAATGPEDFAVEFAESGEKLGEFTVIESRQQPSRLVGEQRLENVKNIVLEPFLAGTYHVAPIQVTFRKKGEEIAKVLFTPNVEIEVTSLLGKDEQATLSDIKPPKDLPWDRTTLLLLAAAGVALLAALIALFFWWRRRRATKLERAAPPLPAHVRALQALDELLAGDLLTKGEVKRFYIRLSNILRTYIEESLGIRAPERTTEEFLSEAGISGRLLMEHRVLLRDFLTSCDLVKFARYEPASPEIDRSVALCRRFIKETEPQYSALGLDDD